MVFIVTLLWMMLWPYRTVDVTEPMSVINTTVQPGEVVRYEIQYCRYTEKDSSISWILVQEENKGSDYFLGSRDSGGLPAGCATINSQTPPVPNNTEPGTYYVKAVVRYQINPLRVITREFVTDSVEVLPLEYGNPS